MIFIKLFSTASEVQRSHSEWIRHCPLTDSCENVFTAPSLLTQHLWELLVSYWCIIFLNFLLFFIVDTILCSWSLSPLTLTCGNTENLVSLEKISFHCYSSHLVLLLKKQIPAINILAWCFPRQKIYLVPRKQFHFWVLSNFCPFPMNLTLLLCPTQIFSHTLQL